MKKLLSVLVVVVFATSMAFGQAGWYHEETVFDFSGADSSLVGGEGSITGTYYSANSPHGVVVDSEGKIWVAMHSGYGPDQSGSPEFTFDDMDDIDDDGVTTGDTSYYKPLFVFNPDGSQADFSPITEVTIDGETDIFHALSPHNGSGKGITIDNDGNILYSSWSTVYRINYQTGEGMNRYIPSDIGLGSITEAVQDPVTGLIYVTWVLGAGKPIVMLDNDFNYLGNAADTLGYISRTIAVRSNDDGSTDLFTGTVWNGFGVVQWHSPNAYIDPFVPVDTLGNEGDNMLWSSSIDWSPDGQLLVGALRESWAGPLGSKWHLLDTETGELTHSFGYKAPDSLAANPDYSMAGGVNGPRGGYFTDATTLYTVDFYLWTLDKWYYTETGVEEEKGLPQAFNLSQNYPNPFNPTTTIPFRLTEAGQVELTIYDLRGQKIQTLVNQRMEPGNHTFKFDGSGLPSGSYIYQIKFNNQMQAKQMVLLK